MKEALFKKRYGIPAALLLVLLVSGTAVAWYGFRATSSETAVEEPLSAAETKEFSKTMYPGETNTWSFDIKNSADVAYTVKADLTFDAPDGVSITSFTVTDAYGTTTNETIDLNSDNSAEFEISAEESVSCSMTISADKDADTGYVTVSLDLNR